MTKPNCVCCICTRQKCPPKSDLWVSTNTLAPTTGSGIWEFFAESACKLLCWVAMRKPKTSRRKRKPKPRITGIKGCKPAELHAVPDERNPSSMAAPSRPTRTICLKASWCFNRLSQFHSKILNNYWTSTFLKRKAARLHVSPLWRLVVILCQPVAALLPGSYIASNPWPNARSIWHCAHQCHGRPGPPFTPKLVTYCFTVMDFCWIPTMPSRELSASGSACCLAMCADLQLPFYCHLLDI